MSRLEQLEEQLREIAARWTALDQNAPQPAQQPTAPAPAQDDSPEPIPALGGLHYASLQRQHDVAAEITRIHEQARDKSILALKDELLPRKQQLDPWTSTAPPASDTSTEPDQRQPAEPEVLFIHVPAVAPEAWGSQAPAAAVGVLGASTWEAKKSAALLSLEAEKRQLQAAVEQLSAEQAQAGAQRQQLVDAQRWELQRVAEQQLAQLQRLQQEHRDQVLELSLSHQKDVRDASGKAGEKLQRLQRSAWQLFIRQRDAKRMACAFFTWQRLAAQSRRLQWAAAIWSRRALDTLFSEWLLITAATKRQRQAETEAVGRQERRLAALGSRSSLLQLRHVLHAWSAQAQRMAAKRQRLARADRHWLKALGRAVLSVLEADASHRSWQLQLARTRTRWVLLVHCFKAWVLLHRLHHLHCRHLALLALRLWQRRALYSADLKHRVAAWQGAWQQRRALLVLGIWQQEAMYRHQLKTAEEAVAGRRRRLVMATCMREMVRARHHAHAVAHMRASRARRVLLAWHWSLRRRSRNRRVLVSHLVSQLAQTLRLVFQQWLLLSGARARRLQADDNTAVQGYVGQLQHELRSTDLQRVAAVERSAAVQEENRRLRVEARQNLVMHAPEGFMNRELRWRSLPPDPDQDPKPLQRSRHLTLLLPGLQGLPGAAQFSDPSDVPALSSTLVVFGGMGADTWYNDVNILELNQSAVGNVSISWTQPLLDPHSAAPAPLPCARDFAGCACGPNQFLIHGGFDGTRELGAMHVLLLHRMDVARPGPAAFALSWRAVVPRNPAPSPRSHHSASYDRAGRTVLVFGGYSSSHGHLSELWAFDFDHMEWWQPETVGDQPGARRGHVAAVVERKLLVHGGFDGTQQLEDLWELDLMEWKWSRLEAKGTPPEARRGHAADVVAGRYLVVHGGYSGSRLLEDGACFDTRNGTWSRLEAVGGPDDTPTPRSFHSLTAVGHACVLLGGAGSLGPLGELHLLENPAITAGQVQLHQLQGARQEALVLQGHTVQLQAQLGRALLERDRALELQQLVEGRAADLAARHNVAVRRAAELQEALELAEGDAAAEAAARRRGDVRAAGLQRRVDRARQGGHQVAQEAEAMFVELCEARAHAAQLELSLQQALAAAHDAQATALQLSGERQALQLQLAAAANETAIVRHAVSSLEQEHGAAGERLRAWADAEMSRLRERVEEKSMRIEELEQQADRQQERDAARASGSGADEAAALLLMRRSASPDAEGSPGKVARSLRGPELAQLQARALSAEMQVELLQKDYASLVQELAAARHEASREHAAQVAATRCAADAVEDKQRLEFRYQRSIEQLEQQIQGLQRAQWARDLDASQHLGGASSASVAALQQLLWHGATPPSSRPATAAAATTPVQRVYWESAAAREAGGGGGSVRDGSLGQAAVVGGQLRMPDWQVDMVQASPGGGGSMQLRIPRISLEPGAAHVTEPGMPHVTELMRLYSVLQDGDEGLPSVGSMGENRHGN